MKHEQISNVLGEITTARRAGLANLPSVREGMDTMKIEKNIPVPNGAGERQGYQHYPWHQMEVGDSFLAPPGRTVRQMKMAAYGWAARHGYPKFTVAQTPGGVRVWRIE